MTARANINCRDLRVQRTYKLLKDAFLQLLSQKSFEQITVQEICETAMVRRTTFYQHFEDKQDFLQWFVREKQQDFSRNNRLEAPNADAREHFLLMAHKVLAYLNENDHILRLLMHAGVQERMLIDAFAQAFVADVVHRLETVPNTRERLNGIPPAVVAEYYVGGMIAVTKWWFSNNNPCTEDELISYMCKLIEGDQAT